MKKMYRIFLFSFLFASGCTGVKSTISGIENESYLAFYSDNIDIINSKIDVVIDNNNPFSVEVNKMRRNTTNFEKRPKGKVYSIKPGKSYIKISQNGKLIYSKKLFVSNQETKIIKL